MAQTIRLRESPSGPFLQDVNGGPAEVGNGSPGRVWRHFDISGAAIAIPTEATIFTVLLNDSFPNFAPLPAGYHYDVRALYATAADSTGRRVGTFAIELSEDGGATWPAPLRLADSKLVPVGGTTGLAPTPPVDTIPGMQMEQRRLFQRVGAALPINAIRLRAAVPLDGAEAVSVAIRAGTELVITQYVEPAT